jgi:dephospho-CoA kinase
VAERVFSDPGARARLDALVHPKIVERILARIATLQARGFRGVVVVDAALMLDWGLERACNAVIAVVAPEAEQVARLVRQRGWTEEEARSRLNVQRTNDEFRAAADVTLDNRGTLKTLERQATEALQRLRTGTARGMGAC